MLADTCCQLVEKLQWKFENLKIANGDTIVVPTRSYIILVILMLSDEL